MDTGNKISGSKNRISIKFIKLITLSLLIMMIAGSTSSVSAKQVWYNNFDCNCLDGLQLYGYDSSSGTKVAIDHGFSISNGALQAPSSSTFDTTNRMFVNSTVSNGTWSFDLTINPIEDTHIGLEYMWTTLDGKYDRVGESEGITPALAYGLIILSYDRNDNLVGPGINVGVLNPVSPNGVDIIKGHSLPKTNLTGTHHIDITRDLTTETKVYLDFALQFSFFDTRVNSSEKFGMTSWKGGASIDNIRVSDVVEEIKAPTTPTAETESSTSTSPIDSTSDSSSSTEDDSPILSFFWIAPIFLIIIRKGRTDKS
ncbi:MAG: hypothetical protein GPJ54_07195 [Candidatus Heimdallarchaeota archaeon]|nr:hypothetical protein [Candidatus Heimdallarchaeota archaeon]